MKKDEIRALANEAYSFLDFEYETALERALLVLKKAPKDPESYLLMAELAEEKEEFEQALAWLDRGLEQNFHEGLLVKKASILLDAFEDIDEAFTILITLAARLKDNGVRNHKSELDPEIVLDIYLLLIDCYRLRSEYAQALNYAQLAKKIAPQNDNAILALSTAHFEMGEYDKALCLLEPKLREEISDFYWLRAQIACAQNDISKADEFFLKANKLDRTRYHRPVRLDDASFMISFDQACCALPREIRDFIQLNTFVVEQIVPLEMIQESKGTLSPEICIAVMPNGNVSPSPQLVIIFQKNIENLASKKDEMKDLIASALLHELGNIVTNA